MNSRPPLSPRLLAAAVLLPCIGLFLVMPPMIGLFAVPRDIAGIPLIVCYLFGVWICLVACAALLSWRVGGAHAPAVAVGDEVPLGGRAAADGIEAARRAPSEDWR
jgi:hypothetical protein